MRDRDGLAETPRPNYRFANLPDDELTSRCLCLWELERQVDGIEPGELALKWKRVENPLYAVWAVVKWASIPFLLLAFLLGWA